MKSTNKNNLIQELAIEFKKTKSELVYNKLYRLLLPQIQNFVKQIVKDEDDAKDVANEVMIKIWQRIDMYNEEWRFSTWVYSISKYDSIQYINAKKQLVSLNTLPNFNGGQSKNSFELVNSEKEFEEFYQAVVKEIFSLTGKKREVLVDREIRGMKYKDLAKKHNVPFETTKTIIRQARIQVLEKLSKKKHIMDMADEFLG